MSAPQTNRTGTLTWDSGSVFVAPPGEWLRIVGDISAAHLIDPTKALAMEIWRSADGVTFQRIIRSTWVGHVQNVDQPYVGLPAAVVGGFFLRALFICTGTVRAGVSVVTVIE